MFLDNIDNYFMNDKVSKLVYFPLFIYTFICFKENKENFKNI